MAANPSREKDQDRGNLFAAASIVAAELLDRLKGVQTRALAVGGGLQRKLEHRQQSRYVAASMVNPTFSVT